MENKNNILQKIDTTILYFEGRRDSIFQDIQQIKKNDEITINELSQSEKFLEIEESKEQESNNIFNLFSDKGRFQEKQLDLKNSIDENNKKHSENQKRIIELENDLNNVLEKISDNKKIRDYIDGEEEKKIIQSEMKSEYENIIEKIQLCIELIDLDKERCLHEMKKIVEDLRKN